MDTTILILATFFIIAVIVISLVLFFMQNAKNKKIKSQLEKLEVEKIRLTVHRLFQSFLKLNHI